MYSYEEQQKYKAISSLLTKLRCGDVSHNIRNTEKDIPGEIFFKRNPIKYMTKLRENSNYSNNRIHIC